MIPVFNSVLSYLLLVFVCVAVAGAGFALGLFLRKKKNASIAKKAQNTDEQ